MRYPGAHGPVPPMGAAGFGFGLLFTPTAPCAPPRSIGRADRARGTECLHPMPVPGSAHTSPSTPTARTCERACCCCAPRSPDLGSLLPSPSPYQCHFLPPHCDARGLPAPSLIPLSPPRRCGRSMKGGDMRCGAPACGGVPPRVPAAGVSLVPRPFSYPFASPSPSLPVPNLACPPLASKFIPPPPPEAGRRVLNILRRLFE